MSRNLSLCFEDHDMEARGEDNGRQPRNGAHHSRLGEDVDTTPHLHPVSQLCIVTLGLFM